MRRKEDEVGGVGDGGGGRERPEGRMLLRRAVAGSRWGERTTERKWVGAREDGTLGFLLLAAAARLSFRP